MTRASRMLTLGFAVGSLVAPGHGAAQATPFGGAAAPAATAVPASLSDLPLTLVEAPPGRLLAVLLSGDGGWAGADRSMAAAFARRNVAVVGLNSPAYLAHGRTPAEAAGDLARILEHFLAAWQRERVIILGYSRGADIGPFMVSGLPAGLRERVALIALLGPGELASFKAGPFDFLHTHSSSGLPVSPEVAKLRGASVLCIFGSGDSGAICPALEQGGLARAVLRNGGHRVHGSEAPSLVAVILSALPDPGAG
jgi:type IV secretory pathway VirJ component